MKKVFTKVLSKRAVDIAMGPAELGLDSWVAQEDELILGYTYAIKLDEASENDGITRGVVELTQANAMNKDGSLGIVAFGEYWNTAPPFGWAVMPSGSVFFAAGKEISLTEGDYLSLLASVYGKSADISYWDVYFVVYYTKKGK
ncbi:hypothetical protein ES705_44694 [subsurface metagenome]